MLFLHVDRIDTLLSAAGGTKGAGEYEQRGGTMTGVGLDIGALHVTTSRRHLPLPATRRSFISPSASCRRWRDMHTAAVPGVPRACRPSAARARARARATVARGYGVPGRVGIKSLLDGGPCDCTSRALSGPISREGRRGKLSASLLSRRDALTCAKHLLSNLDGDDAARRRKFAKLRLGSFRREGGRGRDVPGAVCRRSSAGVQMAKADSVEAIVLGVKTKSAAGSGWDTVGRKYGCGRVYMENEAELK
ncbi:hypothetical protein C8R46DRAFT_1037620 [Mycena filopes]|nr:hypothetical protein C8R46DRAFT_1037620 [Mycena filopes]